MPDRKIYNTQRISDSQHFVGTMVLKKAFILSHTFLTSQWLKFKQKTIWPKLWKKVKLLIVAFPSTFLVEK